MPSLKSSTSPGHSTKETVVKQFRIMSPAASSRWCPTPEQLMILEEMYRGGIRTPNASQIQQITAHLSFYGKIEGKNVFYWFQNHKARDRQKLRRKLSKQLHQQQPLLHHLESPPPPPPPPPLPPAVSQLYHYSSVGFLPQGGVEDSSTQMTMSYTWKVDHLTEMSEMDKSMMGTYGRDCMMMLEVGPTPAPCCNKPLKTLELFPIKATGLKDECTTSKHIPYSTSTN